jgi:predicted nucleic acid-binding Zn finger protein
VSKLTREQRADVHYARRAQWLHVTLRRQGTRAFGIASLSEPHRFYVCDGQACSCPDYRFHGLASVRIGHAGVHQPCSHVLAVQRVLEASPALPSERLNSPWP